MSSVNNGLYFLTLPLVSVMRVIYRKIRHARYLYIKRDVEKVWGARYLSKNTVIRMTLECTSCSLVYLTSRPRRETRYPLNKVLCRLQMPFGRLEELKESSPLPGFEPRRLSISWSSHCVHYANLIKGIHTLTYGSKNRF